LPHLDAWNDRRNALAQQYRAGLAGCPSLASVEQAPWTSTHAYHLFVVRALKGNRDEILKTLHARGIGAGIHYPIAIHQQEAFAPLLKGTQSFPNTELLGSQIFSLPLCGDLRDDEARTVIDALLAAVDAAPQAAGSR
jgi:dTDP-4-amino-4,6-dideoxygalactose transaminase